MTRGGALRTSEDPFNEEDVRGTEIARFPGEPCSLDDRTPHLTRPGHLPGDLARPYENRQHQGDGLRHGHLLAGSGAGRLWVLAIIGLTVGGALLATADVLTGRGLGEFAGLRRTLAEQGGGVVFIRNPADCISSSSPIDAVARQLHGLGIVVRGAVIRGSSHAEAISIANQVFPHQSLSPHAAAVFTHLGYRNTPLAVVVTPSGEVSAVLNVGGLSVNDLVEALTNAAA